MKKTITLFLTLLLLIFAMNFVDAQDTLRFAVTARNFTLADSAGDDNVLFFDIWIRHTNAPTSPPFELALNQYYFNFNPLIANGGTLSLRIVPGSSQYTNPNAVPRLPPNPITGTPPNLLNFNSNIALGPGNGPIIDSIVGTRVLTARLATTAPSFALVPLNLVIRYTIPGPFTKIFAYLGTTSTDVTTRGTYSVDSGSIVLPIELASFTSSVKRNNVTLNWATNKEINNSGFEIERRVARGQAQDVWSKIGFVQGNGNSNEAKNYTFSDRINTGKYNYRLKQIDYNGNFEYFPLSNEVVVGIPDKYNMSQNYPNPFNPTTKIDYELPYDGKVSIVLYDMRGREIAKLVNEVKTAGYYSVQLNASSANGGLASGMYFYRLVVSQLNPIIAQGNNNNFVMTKKMVLIK